MVLTSEIIFYAMQGFSELSMYMDPLAPFTGYHTDFHYFE